jgi:hypothetical protein
MTNSELVDTPDRALQQSDRKRKFALCTAMSVRPCPACREWTTQIEATGKPLDQFNADDPAGHAFVCPHCGIELTLTAAPWGTFYNWQRKHPLPEGETERPEEPKPRRSLADMLERAVRSSRRRQGLDEEPSEEQRAAMQLFLGIWPSRPVDDTGDKEAQQALSDRLRAARQGAKKARRRRGRR